ncbi:MAG TPA: portal protein [Ruminococcaceae bacterium]|nr:portal protein [Oscillospiraceae bacterium]
MYSKIDYEIAKELNTYGNAFEYVYSDNSIIKSHIIPNESSYPVYDEQENYTAFIEHWKDMESGHENYIVYYPDHVDTWQDSVLKDTKKNLSGLPIHYMSMDKTEYNFFGDSPMNDLMPIVDQIEQLLSKMDDATSTLSMNPLGVSQGQRINESIPEDICGATLNLEDGGDFKYVTASLDYNSIKLLLDNLIQELYTIACVPSAVVGQSNVANISEVSLKLLFSQTDNRAKQTIQVLKEGFAKRFEYIVKLLQLQGINFSQDDIDSVDITFTVNRPVDTNNMMNELKTQRDMGAISIQSIIEHSPYTVNSASELQRLQEESKNITVTDENK